MVLDKIEDNKERSARGKHCCSRYHPLQFFIFATLFTFSANLAFSPKSFAFPISGMPGMSINDTLPFTGRLAFSAKVNGDQKIILIDMASKKGSILIDSRKEDWEPVFHPNGGELLFISSRENRASLYRSDTDGRNIRRITPDDSPLGNPDWDRDPTKRIAYYYKETKGPSHTNLYSYDLTKRKEVRLTNFDGRTSTPRVSPDGKYLAYSTNRFWPGWDVCLFNLQNRVERCILKGIDSYCRPSWKGDGSTLLYSWGSGDSIALGEYNVSSSQKTLKQSLQGRIYDAIYISDENLVFANNQSGSFDLYLKIKDKSFPLVEAPYDIRYPTWHKSSIMEQEIQRLKSTKK